MFDFLEKLRQKPDRIKKQIAFFTAFFIAGVIFVVWLSVLYPDFKQDQAIQKKVSAAQANPTQNFTSLFSQGFAGLKEQYDNLKNSISNYASSTAYYAASTSEKQASTTP